MTDERQKPKDTTNNIKQQVPPDKVLVSRQLWENIPPEVKSLHANLYKPFWVRTRYGTTEVGILVGARWDLAQLHVLTEETVYDPNIKGYITRTILKVIEGNMVVAYGPVLREEAEEQKQ